MVELLPLVFLSAQAVAQIENALTEQRVGPNQDPDQIVCVRETRIGTRLDTRRVCRTRAEWAALEADTRNTIQRVQIFPGGCEDRSLCQGNQIPGLRGGN
mgnify:CR=1 FL=1